MLIILIVCSGNIENLLVRIVGDEFRFCHDDGIDANPQLISTLNGTETLTQKSRGKLNLIVDFWVVDFARESELIVLQIVFV